jgi:DNA modification methylase
VFLLSKSEHYHYDYEAIKEPTTQGDGIRNRRTVWAINTEAYRGAHFAVFPPELVRLCVLAGSTPASPVLDPFMGSGTTGAVCVELGRRFVGIELKPEYAELARQRLTGQTAGLAF